MTSPVTTPRRPAEPIERRRRIALIVAAVIGALLVLALTQWLLAEPSKVSSVHLVNSSDLDIRVAVSGSDAGATLGLAVVPARATRTVEGVLDQGDTWVFHYSSGPFVADPVAVARRTLEADGWRVEIPATVITRLTQMGARPVATSKTG